MLIIQDSNLLREWSRRLIRHNWLYEENSLQAALQIKVQLQPLQIKQRKLHLLTSKTKAFCILIR